MAQTCRASGADPIVIVLGCHAEAIARGCDLSGARVVMNADYESGQTSSVKSGLRALDEHATAFLLLPVDHALVTTNVIDSLIDRFKQQPDAAGIYLPTHHGKHGHPALFGADYIEQILALPCDIGANQVVAQNRHHIVEVPANDPWVLFDIDTEEDYQTALAEFTRRQTGG